MRHAPPRQGLVARERARWLPDSNKPWSDLISAIVCTFSINMRFSSLSWFFGRVKVAGRFRFTNCFTICTDFLFQYTAIQLMQWCAACAVKLMVLLTMDGCILKHIRPTRFFCKDLWQRRHQLSLSYCQPQSWGYT